MPAVLTRRDLATLDDRDLMAEVAADSRAAFGELYDRYGERAYRIAHAVCHNDACAGDIVLEAFQSIWRDRGNVQPDGASVGAGLLVAVRAQAMERRRETDPAGADATQMEDLLARLPEAEQAVIILAVYGQLSHADIATALGLSGATVKGRMRTGMHQLRDGAAGPRV